MRRLLAPLGVAVIVTCTACGGGSRAPRAQPAPSATAFQPGGFDELPRYPRSDPLEPTQDRGGVQTRSFKAQGATSEQIVRWYAAHLPGWRQDGAVRSQGQTWTGEWSDAQHILHVTSDAAPTLGGPDTVQYSLVYQPH